MQSNSMLPPRLRNYVAGEWVTGSGKPAELFQAVTGQKISEASTGGIEYAAMVHYARTLGGPASRKLTFHERARRLKALASHLMAGKDAFYQVSAMTGATKTDSWIDIEGGIGTLF